MPLAPIQRMDDVVDGALARPGFYASAVASFALTAMVLAAFGIYGTVTSAVAWRRRELGVRLALGASRRDVLMRAAGSGATPTLIGITAGVPLALAAGRILRDQLYRIAPTTGPRSCSWPGSCTGAAHSPRPSGRPSRRCARSGPRAQARS